MPDFSITCTFFDSTALTTSFAAYESRVLIVDTELLLAQGPRVYLAVVGQMLGAEMQAVTYGENFGFVPQRYDTLLTFAQREGWALTRSPIVEITELCRKRRFIDIGLRARRIGGTGAVQSATVYVTVPSVRRVAGIRAR